MTNFYPFIQGLLGWPFSELFSANASLCNQHKYIALSIFSLLSHPKMFRNKITLLESFKKFLQPGLIFMTF